MTIYYKQSIIEVICKQVEWKKLEESSMHAMTLVL